MKERLLGVETEYAVAATMRNGKNQSRETFIARFMNSAREKLPHIPDFGAGMYLQNGSRFYLDCGLHPELTTPECTSPAEAVAYIAAGEQLLGDVGRHLESTAPEIREVQIFRTNVDYSGTQSTWGCHESYLHQANPQTIADHIVPHLVSRVIYTGAGGFNPLSNGLEFSLSPRVAHMRQVISSESTHNRGIFHTKNETLAKQGYNRLHIICGESLSSQTASWLKLGTTALVVALIEAGLCDSQPVRLKSPLEAMQSFARDVDCTVTAESQEGRPLTAIEIQRHYLNLVEANLDRGFMPSWSEQVCRQWRLVLNHLEQAPDSLNSTLDWSIKRCVYVDRAFKSGVEWKQLPHWTDIVSRISAALVRTEHRDKRVTAELVLDSKSPVKDVKIELTPVLEKAGLTWDGLKPFIDLRYELLEIDMRFGQLRGKSIFSVLDRAGLLQHRILTSGDTERATASPPALGRARMRGEFVGHHAADGRRYRCDWQGIWDFQDKRVMDLSNPFESGERWRNFTEAEEEWGPGAEAFDIGYFYQRLRRR